MKLFEVNTYPNLEHKGSFTFWIDESVLDAGSTILVVTRPELVHQMIDYV
jgi:hypothetical protein